MNNTGRITKIIREVNVGLMTITGGQEDHADHVKSMSIMWRF
jgi:hypothetical protein